MALEVVFTYFSSVDDGDLDLAIQAYDPHCRFFLHLAFSTSTCDSDRNRSFSHFIFIFVIIYNSHQMELCSMMSFLFVSQVSAKTAGCRNIGQQWLPTLSHRLVCHWLTSNISNDDDNNSMCYL